MTDPSNDPWLKDSATQSGEIVGGKWGWIAGIAVLVLIAIILIAGWNSNTHLANNPPAATTGSATAPITPPASKNGSAPAAYPTTPPPIH